MDASGKTSPQIIKEQETLRIPVVDLGIDRTKSAQAEKALLDGEEFFRPIFEAAPIAIAVVNREAEILRAAPAFEALLGYTEDELRHKTVCELTHPADLHRTIDLFGELVDGKRGTFHVEKRYLPKDAGLVWCNTTVAPVRTANGECQHAIVMLEDITKRKQAEEEARRLKNQLAHAARVTTVGKMAAGLAHELNQPLAAIANYAESCQDTLRSGQVNAEELFDAMERVTELTLRAGKIIQRIRTLVRKGEPNRSLVRLNDLIREVVGLIDPEARINGVTMRRKLADELPMVLADPVQIQQVILNLVLNALEAMDHIEKSQRELTIQTAGVDSGSVEVAVRDTGHGLLVDNTESIFEHFFTTKPQGIGVGLAISRSIIEAHGGRLWAEPNSDAGTTFRFTLPMNQPGTGDAG